jgi:hypothetical protein
VRARIALVSDIDAGCEAAPEAGRLSATAEAK